MGYYIKSVENSSITFVVVENRVNDEIKICFRSLENLPASVYVVDDVGSTSIFSDFEKKYIHNSTNSRSFELICFRRYFLLRNLYETGVLDGDIVLVDSDTIVHPCAVDFIYSVSSDFEFMGSIAMAGDFDECQISPHFSFWRKSAIFDFTNFLVEAYGNKVIIERMKGICMEFSARGLMGGISDMTLLYLWVENKNVRFGLVNSPRGNLVVDHNLSMANNGDGVIFENQFGVKRLVTEGDELFFKSGDQLYRPVVIHFQGRAKMLMHSVQSKNLCSFAVRALMLRIARIIKFAYISFRNSLRG